MRRAAAVSAGDARGSAPRRPGRRGRIAGALALLLVVVVLLVRQPARLGPPDGRATPAGSETRAAATAPRGDYPFGDRSVWRTSVRDAPLNQRSAEMVAGVAEQVAERYEGVAAFNVDDFSTSFYTVTADQPRVDVAFDDCQDKDWVPDGLTGRDGQFSDVPVPDDAVPARGSDGQLTIYSPATDQLWEFWRAERVDGEWQACWGGRIDRVSRSRGYFRGGYGSSASGLAISGGMVRVEDVRAGRIEHAVALQLVDTKAWWDYSWPAQRSDGNLRDADAVPEGLRLRLDPDVDLDALSLTPVARMVAEAAQTYGFIVVDRAGAVAITAETGQATRGEDPWPELLGGVVHYDVMAGFPWGRLQALPQDYGKPPPSTAPATPTSTRTPTGSSTTTP